MSLPALFLAISCCLLSSHCIGAWSRGIGAAGVRQQRQLMNVEVTHRQLQQQQVAGNTTAGTLGYWGPSIGTYLVPDLGGQPVIAMASGWRFVVVLFKNQSVTAWGNDDYLQVEVPVAARAGPVKAIAAGKTHALALLETGKVVQWGDPAAGTAPPEAQQNVTAIWAGDSNSFAQLSTGRIIGWGKLQSIASVLPTLQNVTYLAETPSNGYVVLFNNGTLLNCTTYDGPVPNTPLVVQGVRSVAVSMAAVKYGPPHVIIVFKDNTTVAWGGNGDNRAAGASGLTDVAAAAASIHSMVLFNNGTVKGFGFNKYGQVSVPPSLPTNSPVTAIAIGDTHSGVLRGDGSVFVWGRLYGVPDPILPPIVKPPAAIVSVSSSWYHSLVLKADGSVVAFGVNFTGETAVPDIIQNNAVAISAGRNHSLVLTKSGRVVSFGALKDSDVPPVALSGVVAIAAGGLFSVAVKNDSSLVVWGTSPNMTTCSLNSTQNILTNGIKQISAGDNHVLVLLSDGSVHAWGCGQAAVVPPNIANSAVAVAAANQHSVVLLQNGQVLYFGEVYGVVDLLTTTNTLSGVTMIAAGSYGVCVMTSGNQLTYYGNKNFYNFDPLSLLPGTTAASLALGAESVLAVVIPSSQSNTQPTVGASTSATKHAFPMAAVAAIVAVVVVVGVAAAIGALWWCKRGKPCSCQPEAEDKQQLVDGMVTCVVEPRQQQKPLVIPGLMFGEVFIHTTARAYTWADADVGLDMSHVVEPGVNDTQLDQLLQKSNDGSAEEHTLQCPVVQLTKQQAAEQIQLLPDGLLGKGATAYCFKCVWPSRFGNALLAAKVLKEGTNPDINSLQSFVYEACVLESAIHPNIVRMYGYCLEPPVVCLILELMPYSLKDLLYKHVQPASTHVIIHETASTGREQHQSHFQTSTTTAATGSTIHAHQVTQTNTQSRFVTANSRFSSSAGVTAGVGSALGDTSSAFAFMSVSRPGDHPTHPSTTTVTGSVQNVDSGATVNNHMKSRLNMLQVLRYSSDIAAGLAYLHSTPVRHGIGGTDATTLSLSGMMTTSSVETDSISQDQRAFRIVHRDLKPANVMISWRGVAKLSDFGLARQHDNTTVVTSGVGAGTLPYMAPELLVSSMAGMSYQNPTNRVDIYSMAMMMWEMLAGQTPWDGMNEAGIITAVVSGRRPELQGATLSTQSVITTTTRASLSSVPDEDNHTNKADWLLASQQQVTAPLSTLPASLDALPEFNAIIKACWHHRELRRPTAATVSEALSALLAKYMAQEQQSSTAGQIDQPV